MTRYDRAVEQLKELHASGFDVGFEELHGVLHGGDVWPILLADALRVGLIVGDLHGNFISASPAIEDLLGYDNEELRRLGSSGITHPEDRDKDTTIFLELLGGARERYQLEKRYIRKDGQTMWGLLTVMLLKDSAGVPTFEVAMIEDITEIKLTQDYERHLKAAAERREQALELNDVVIQGLIVAKWAVDRGDENMIRDSLDSTLAAAHQLIDRLLKDTIPDQSGPDRTGSQRGTVPGDLVRS